MKKHCIYIVLGTILLAAIVRAESPQRIVSLKPAVTDTIYALGFGERLVGITKYCDVPEGSTRPQIAADYTRPYAERIIALKPDLVIGSEENSSRRSIESLERAGIRVRLFPFTTLDDSLASVQQIGELLGRPDRGKLISSDLRHKLNSMKRRYGGRAPMKAVIVWGLRPMIIAGTNTYMDDAMHFIGLSNAAERTRVPYPKIGLEQLIGCDPDVIVDLSMDTDKGQAAERPWDRVEAIKAVREARVIRMDPALFRAGPGIAAALETLAKQIHGK